MKKEITLSLAMIVKNEESILDRCLSCSNIFDEIIIVDTGSTDKTKEVASKYTNKIYDFEWIDNFSAARNFAFEQATCDYIMWLDADDIILEDDRRKLIELKKDFDTSIDMAVMWLDYTDGNGKSLLRYRRERVIRNDEKFKWIEPVHECIPFQGKVENFEITTTHSPKHSEELSTRNIDIYEKQEKLSPRSLFYYARELRDHGKWNQAFNAYSRFMGLNQGWPADSIQSCIDLYDISLKLDSEEVGIGWLLRSLKYGFPSAEVCCRLGDIHFRKENYTVAKHWYELATNVELSDSDFGFHRPDYATYIPYMQLCVIYDKLGDKKKAFDYHNLAKLVKPDSPQVAYNEDYFNKGSVDCV